MSHNSRNIFLAFSNVDKLQGDQLNKMRKKSDGTDTSSRAKSQSSDDCNESGLRRSNRSNKGIAREMFDPSHIPTPTRKSNPVPAISDKEDTPDSSHTPEPKNNIQLSKKKDSSEEDSDSASDNEQYNDPQKLWCICRKPHGGRFMISCDVCEEWFHGDCVGISVNRGKKMEKKGEEYVCPACIEKSSKKQKSVKKEHTEKVAKPKSGVKLKGYAHGNTQMKTDATKEVKKEDKSTQPRICIVSSCNNPAQPDSIYCSNVCILRHAKESLGGIGKIAKSLKVEKSDKKAETKDERIVRKIKEASSRGKVAVMCMKTGKIFANASAPMKGELEKFLQKNPTFQRLKIPKSYKQKLIAKEQQKKDVEKSKPPKNSAASDVAMDGKALASKYSDDPDYNPEEKHFANPYKQYTPISPRNENKDKAKKHKLSHQDSGEAKKLKHKSHDNDRRASLEKGSSSKIPAKRDIRHLSDEKSTHKKDHNEKEVRKNVQKTLQGILQSRSNNSDDLKMHPDSINKLVGKVEDSLYKLFGGVNSKYKNRYRSIMFNLKDDKNEGLWRKVILGEVTSSRLVKMTAEEMASKELAQWRKHELKQELEMIQELEVANQTTRPVAKITHKGEIAINEDYSDLTESHLNHSTEKSVPTIAPQRIRRISATQPDNANDISTLPLDTTSQHNSHLFDLNCMICTGQIKEEKVNLDEASNKTVKRSTSIILSNEAQTPAEKETDEEIIKKINAFSKKRDSISEKGESDDNLEEGDDESSKTPEEDESAAIAMPEPAKREFRKPSWENFLWTGTISMPELSNFRSNAYAASGNSKELVNCIPQKLAMDGRIHPKVVWEYLARVRSFSNKEVCVIQFHAASEEDRAGYVGMLSYFSSRKRFGVVSNQNTQFVKDIYVAPLIENEAVPRQLMPLRGPGIPSEHPSMLIGIIVRCVAETKRPIVDIDQSFARISGLDNTAKRMKLTTDTGFNVNDEIKAPRVEEEGDNEPYSPKDEDNDDDEEYNPETANFGNILDGGEATAPTEEEEAYDPEKLTFEDSAQQNEDDEPYDPEDDAERLESSEVKALQEKQAFLEKMKQDLEMQKAELAKEEMTLQIQQIAPNPVSKPKKTVSQTQVDPRVAARMRNKTTTPTTTSGTTDNPLQTIFSVLNIDRTSNA